MKKDKKLDFEGRSEEVVVSRDPGKMILSEIDRVRKQVKKVEQLSDEVHKGYNKQKQDKDKLNKKR